MEQNREPRNTPTYKQSQLIFDKGAKDSIGGKQNFSMNRAEHPHTKKKKKKKKKRIWTDISLTRTKIQNGGQT